MKCPFRRVVTTEIDHPLRGGEAFESAGYEIERMIAMKNLQIVVARIVWHFL